MEVEHLDFVRQCKRLAKQALGKHAGEPPGGGLARWKHVVLHCIRLQENYPPTDGWERVMVEDDPKIGDHSENS